MALSLPPASNLHAILLVTKSRSLGPRLVFHYPPLSPSAAAIAAAKAPTWFRNEGSTNGAASQSSDSEWDSSTETDEDIDVELASRISGERGSGRTSTAPEWWERDRSKLVIGAWGKQETIDEEDAGNNNEGGRRRGNDYDWDTVLGFRTDALEKMLSPNKEYNKRRFELGVESIVFLGAPMFVREDGLWKKLKRKKKKESEEERLADSSIMKSLTIPKELEGMKTSATRDVQRSEILDDTTDAKPEDGPTSDRAKTFSTTSNAGSDTRSNSTTHDSTPDMTMFNIIFVLSPPALEYHQRIRDVYENVSRKYAKALKYEQARSQYVWKESKHIIYLKQRAKETNESLTATWRHIISTSALARSIAIMFDAISQDKIAHIHFGSSFNTSFQIPQADSTPYLPNALEPQMPGLWLTTSNVIVEDDQAPMTQHAALLLLEDAEVLIKDLGGENAESAAAIAFYIRSLVPTKSLLKISKYHNIPAQDMEYIASHLVYGRRARLIAPLSPRDTYIVSPNADMTRLSIAIAVYARRFPTLPTMPKVLSILSGTPRPFRNLIPSTEHREAYMEILAWLMRGAWVTQLRTFAWVRVTPEIKAQVAAEVMKEERVKKVEEIRKEMMSDHDSIAESMLSDKRSSLLSLSSARSSTPLHRSRRDKDQSADGDEDSIGSGVTSPRLTATTALTHRPSPVRPASDAGSTSSQRTTIGLHSSQRPNSPSHLAIRDVKPHRPSPLHFKSTSPSRVSIASSTSQVDASPAPNPKDFTPSTIFSPQKASSLEARWLGKIGETFENANVVSTNPSPPKHTDGASSGGLTGKELREGWTMLLRHLDGKHAIEDVSAREGMKRKRVAVLFNAVRERGWLVVTKHW